MTRTDKRLALCYGLLTANLLFIWGNSLLPAEISAAISGSLRSLLGLFLPGGGNGIMGTGDGTLRKIAHFLEFLTLGMCLCWLMAMLQKPCPFALLGGFSAACVDEILQVFVPGRGPGIWDVALDTCGVLAGILLLRLAVKIHTSRKRKA